MQSSLQIPPQGADDQSPIDMLAWDAFVTSRTAEERCYSWLGLVCGRITGAQAAAVLVESLEAHTYVPIAVWPEAKPDLGRLAGVVEETLRERRAVVRVVPESAGLHHLAYPLMLDQRIEGIVALEVLCTAEVVDLTLRKIHWGSAWLANLLAGRQLEEAIRGKERVGSVLETMAVALRHGKMQQAMFELVNALRQQFHCTRVAIGLAENADVKLLALSEAAAFEKRTALVKAYVSAMREAYDLHQVVQSPTLPESIIGSSPRVPMHEELKSTSGAGVALSHPLVMGAQCVGIVTLERESQPFSADDLAWMDAFSALLAPVIVQRRKAERGALGRLREDVREVLSKFFGPRHLIWKVSAASALLLVLFMVLLPFEYRVTAKTVIEGEVQRIAAAPFEGFIGTAYVRAGDIVKTGQALAQLDDRELRIEQARWDSERKQYSDKLREAVATHDLTSVQVVTAQLDQAEEQLKLVTEKIRRARLAAPFDGIVVSGDLSQKIGSPVQLGEKLFEIAPLQSYRIILQVDEREIRHIKTAQQGRLVITGIAGEPMPFKVSKVTPVATAQDGKNFFRVEATLAEASPHLRPGMEGIGKIEVGSHSLWWIFTHQLTDWLILKLWTWLP
jgi:hypothetical protein